MIEDCAGGSFNPPPLAALGALLALLPFAAATAVFDVLCVAGLLAALRIVGVGDRGILLVALGCFPFVSSLALAQPDGLLALCAAPAWRCRGTTASSLLSVGVLIAAKLLAWPLVLWLLATRRDRGRESRQFRRPRI